MAKNTNRSEFEIWLSEKLKDLDVDDEVYGSYITGVLTEEEDEESKREALEGILTALVEDPEDLCAQVLKKWKPFNSQNGDDREEKQTTVEDILAAHSAKVVSEKSTVVEKSMNDSTDAALKRALLEKYSEVYEEVDENEERQNEKMAKSSAPPTLGLFQNVNIKSVTDAEKQKRDKQKEEHNKKKEKDKLDRENQKQKKEERKEKEKKRTQKKERSGR